jgi:hypothetical protein
VSSPVYTIDVAHPPRKPDDVEAALLDAWESIRNSSTLRILKIVHGYGSGGSGGTTRDTVRNWAFRQKGRFRAVVYGEDYEPSDPATAAMRTETGNYGDTDLTMQNRGITIIWVK